VFRSAASRIVVAITSGSSIDALDVLADVLSDAIGARG
jgi:hypothetical protein